MFCVSICLDYFILTECTCSWKLNAKSIQISPKSKSVKMLEKAKKPLHWYCRGSNWEYEDLATVME